MDKPASAPRRIHEKPMPLYGTYTTHTKYLLLASICNFIRTFIKGTTTKSSTESRSKRAMVHSGVFPLPLLLLSQLSRDKGRVSLRCAIFCREHAFLQGSSRKRTKVTGVITESGGRAPRRWRYTNASFFLGSFIWKRTRSETVTGGQVSRCKVYGVHNQRYPRCRRAFSACICPSAL